MAAMNGRRRVAVWATMAFAAGVVWCFRNGHKQEYGAVVADRKFWEHVGDGKRLERG